MLYALYNGTKVAAVKGERMQGARCPGCDAPVIAKCGDVKAWHWAHASGADCDPWHEGETRWHLEWKAKFPQECVEVSLGPHRADVKLGTWVMEFQNSSISGEEIREREAFYGRLLWVFNAKTWHVHLKRKLKPGVNPRDTRSLYWHNDDGSFAYRLTDKAYDNGPYRSFRFRWPHMTLSEVDAPMFWDLGEAGILHVKKVYWDIPTGGWGMLYTQEDFMNRWSPRIGYILNTKTA